LATTIKKAGKEAFRKVDFEYPQPVLPPLPAKENQTISDYFIT
jgi:hypothetical protein